MMNDTENHLHSGRPVLPSNLSKLQQLALIATLQSESNIIFFKPVKNKLHSGLGFLKLDEEG